jgi:hypothetical protein
MSTPWVFSLTNWKADEKQKQVLRNTYHAMLEGNDGIGTEDAFGGCEVVGMTEHSGAWQYTARRGTLL